MRMRTHSKRLGGLVLLTLAVALAIARSCAQVHRAPRLHSDESSQSAVAAKTHFSSLPAADPAVKRAIDARDIDAAKKLIGKESAFQGTVTKVFSPRSNSIVILDFAPNFRDAVTAVVKPPDYAKFPDLQTLTGKHVLVRGKFTDYQGRPQIVLTAPSQISLINEARKGK